MVNLFILVPQKMKSRRKLQLLPNDYEKKLLLFIQTLIKNNTIFVPEIFF
jgi:hypothetical protein